MKTTIVAIAVATSCSLAAGIVHAAPLDDCRAANAKGLSDLQAQYQVALQVAKLTKAQQDQYQSQYRLAASRDSIAERKPGNSLNACEGQGRRIASAQQTLDGMMPPRAKVGDKAKGGVVVKITDFGQHGLVAGEQDCETKWGRITWQAATSACGSYRGGGFSDWYLPETGELSEIYAQRAVVGGLANDAYWSSTKLTYGPMKDWDNQVYFVQFASGGTSMWAYVNKDGPNRALFYSRAVRKF
jgi:hypothetical protein